MHERGDPGEGTLSKAVGIFSLVLFVSVGRGADLVPCPDCVQPVSPRAVMCPKCGCPGDAIQAAVVQRQRIQTVAHPQHPYVRLETERLHGYALALSDGGIRYLVMDAMLVADATSLSLALVATNVAVSYSQMQVADNEPLVRFRTDATNLVFLTRAVPRADRKSFWLTDGGTLSPATQPQIPPPGVLALVDGKTNLLAAVCANVNPAIVASIPNSADWKDVAPVAYRSQMALLVQAEREAREGGLDATTAVKLTATQWVSAFLKKRAEEVLRRAKEITKP